MDEENFNSKMIKIVRDIIQNKLPTPLPINSPDARRAWNCAEAGIDFVSEGRIKEAIRCMIRALRLGVPEPANNDLCCHSATGL